VHRSTAREPSDLHDPQLLDRGQFIPHVSAQFSGTATSGQQRLSLIQQVNNRTIVMRSKYCNTGSVALNDSAGPAWPICVALPVAHLRLRRVGQRSVTLAVTLEGVTYPESQDIDALLVGPSGQSFHHGRRARDRTPAVSSATSLHVG